MLIESCRGEGGIAKADDGPGTTEANCGRETALFAGLLLLTPTFGMAVPPDVAPGEPPVSSGLVDLWPEDVGSIRVADEGT